MKKLPKLNLSGVKKVLPKSKKVGVASGVVLVLIAVTSISYFVINRVQNNSQKNLSKQLDDINNNGAKNCTDALEKVGGAKSSDVKDDRHKEQLLLIQDGCYTEKGQFDQAIAVNQELKTIYNSRNDTQSAKKIDERIENIKQLKASGYKAPPENIKKQSKSDRIDVIISSLNAFKEKPDVKSDKAKVEQVNQKIKELEAAKTNKDLYPELNDENTQ